MERKQSTMTKLKGKLISALCMLLVAATMVISSSYAWFTLSTAPEVSGITTAIGANGALEIWLNTNNTNDENYVPGNIVNLGSELYGLNQINLLPAALNVLENGKLATNYLMFPEYNANGRPGNLDKNSATTGTFSGASFFEDDDTGVRAVGVASGLTERQSAYRNAKQTANTNMSLATSRVVTSLNTNGSILGNIIIKKATTENATYTAAEVAAIGAVIEDLEAAVGYIKTAYEEMIVALAASALVPETEAGDLVYSIIRSDIAEGRLTLANIAATGSITVGEDESAITVSLKTAGGEDSALLAAIKDFNAMYDDMYSTTEDDEGVSVLYDALESKESYEWGDISGVLNGLININHVTLNDKAVSGGVTKEELANSVLNQGINIQLNAGSGVYADIADHCGKYNAVVEMTNVSAAGYNFDKLTANMEVPCSVSIPYLKNALTQVEDIGGPVGSGSTAMPMTEFYGFILDLAFRTNAANSNLLLQTEAADRIYEDNNNEATQGKGSYMTYKATTTELTTDQVKSLMACIRIVFFTPDDDGTSGGTILGEARLDTEGATIDANGVTAKMYMYKTTEVEVEGEVETVGVLQNGTDTNNDSSITSLAQNDAVKISVLVYLDGAKLENKDVAATAASSVTGTMNLQFASDADLKPMEYGKLHTPATNNGGEGTN